ncbi:MAG: hypothetical protein HW390_340 [Candidatus Brocadiaceae bacterium]|nr:hypothetical protein [Candidatus Brocadiaceae bacterium]
MGVNPQDSSTITEFSCQFRVEIRARSLAAILVAFSKLLPQILTDFIQKVLNQR